MGETTSATDRATKVVSPMVAKTRQAAIEKY
jgi:hypothetical protein